MTDTELMQLHARVIALENLLIAVLAQGTDRQLELARVMVRNMSIYISPRPGSADHPLTIHAATQMNHMIERATHFSAARDPS